MNKTLIIANWKMNPQYGTEAKDLFTDINKVASKLASVETVICPPLIYLESLGALVSDRSCVVGAQDAFWEHNGAFTGQVSPDMIFNARARYVIVGHSERRAIGETDEIVNKKIKNILQFPLIPIVCVGESVRDDEGDYVTFLNHQIKQTLQGLSTEELQRLVIAYEPVWAIGKQATRECSPAECNEAVQLIKQVLVDLLGDTEQAMKIPIVYGGSAHKENTQSLLTEGGAQGLLVGRASLESKEFIEMLKIAEKISA